MPTDPFVHSAFAVSPRLLKLTRMGSRRTATVSVTPTRQTPSREVTGSDKLVTNSHATVDFRIAAARDDLEFSLSVFYLRDLCGLL